METKTLPQMEEKDPILSETEKGIIVSNELAVIPAGERNELIKVLKTDDIILIDSHKKKIRSFKARFPAKKFEITEGLVYDKDIYEKALEQWREVKNYRTKNVEPDFKNLKAPYVALTKFYNEATTPIIAEYKAIEKPISDFVDRMEELQKQEKEKEARAFEQKVNDRRDAILNAGIAFDGEYYSIGSEEFNVPTISLGVVDLQTMTDAIFENILQQIVEKNADISEQQKNKDAAALKEQQELADKKEKERLQLIADQEKVAADQKKLDDEKMEIQNQRIEVRSDRLINLGMEPGTDGCYTMGKMVITKQYLAETSTADWTIFIADFKQELKKAKEKQIETDRLNKIEEEKKAVSDSRMAELKSLGVDYNKDSGKVSFLKGELHIIEDFTTIPAQTWEKYIETLKPELIELKSAEDKKIADAKIAADKVITDKAIADKKLADDKKEKERIDALAKAGDQALWNDFISRINAISYPEVKSNDFMIKVAKVKAFHESLK